MLLFDDSFYSPQIVNFTKELDNWIATTILGTPQTLNLGLSQEFGFYFLDGTTKYEYYDLTESIPNTSYYLDDDNTGMKVLVAGAAPVPLPASVLFLASGVARLIAFGRVRRNS